MRKTVLKAAAMMLLSFLLFSCKGPASGPSGPVEDPSTWSSLTYRYGVGGFTDYYDAKISQSSPAVNYGLDSQDSIGSYAGSDQRLLIQFYLPDLPAGAVVKKATISLERTSYFNVSATAALAFYEIMSPWNENTCTWNNSMGSTPWASSGGSAGTEAIGGAVSITGPASGFVTWDLDLTWIGKCFGVSQTYGIVLKENSISGNKDIYFNNKESALAADRPLITVYYKVP